MILENTVIYLFITVTAAIVVDTVLGVVKSFKAGYDSFDIRLLPKFLATGILPYVGGLGIIALAAQFIGEPYAVLFYTTAAGVTAKYVAEIKDKLMAIFGLQLGSDGGIGGAD